MTRQEVQDKSKEIGHCVCCKLFTCPCKFFTDKNICHCAGEQHPELTMGDWIKYNTKTK